MAKAPIAKPFPFTSGSSALLFTDKSFDVRSAAFFIPMASGILFKTWGIGHDTIKPPSKKKKRQFAIVEMLLVERPGVAHRSSMCECDDDNAVLFPDMELIDETCVMQCGMWALQQRQNLVALTVPGIYRIRLSSAEAIGNVFLEAVRLNALDISVLPKDILLGNMN